MGDIEEECFCSMIVFIIPRIDCMFLSMDLLSLSSLLRLCQVIGRETLRQYSDQARLPAKCLVLLRVFTARLLINRS